MSKKSNTRIPLPSHPIKAAVMTLALFVLFGLMTVWAQETEHDALEYDLNVSAQIIPIYAVDSKGNPVFDLKENEIELYIDGKKQDIITFQNYRVEENAKTSGASDVSRSTPEKTAVKAQSPIADTPPSPERIVFIILDGISNSSGGVRNGKNLARRIIKDGGPGDAFIIFTSSIKKGLQYITGPEKNKTKLFNTIDKLYQNPTWIVTVPKKNFLQYETPDPGEVAMWENMMYLVRVEKRDNQDQYALSLNRFSRSLQELKHALKTIRLPKHIFLISGGIQEMAIINNTSGKRPGNHSDMDMTAIFGYYGMLNQAAQAINQGGSLLYVVNPVPEVYKNRKAARVMNRVSNAQCITGSNPGELMEKIKQNTAAYYELAFSITQKMNEDFQIDVKCKRKGIRLNTLKFGEKSRPYRYMKATMKKLFSLNVVMGGSWARMVADISVAQSRKTGEEKNRKDNTTIKKVDVKLPASFQGEMVDIFTLNVEPKTLKATIQLSKRLASGTETIDIPVEPNRKQFFVIIEPNSTQCIVNRVL